MIKKCIASALVLLIMAVPGLAADNPYGYYQKNEQLFEQDVEGNGFATTYQKINTETLQLQNFMKGSGDIDTATIIGSKQWSSGYYPLNGKWTTTHNSNISFLQQNEMTYLPQSFVYGTGYYEANPVVYNSKLKERTSGKSYQEGVSMLHQIEYAEGFTNDIEVNLTCTEPKLTEYGTKVVKGLGYANMRIDDDVTEGTVSIGELVTKKDGSEGLKSPLTEIDEYYAGSFKILKNMEYTTEKSMSKRKADWLSCCFGGYADMNSYETYGIEEAIFNCNCYGEVLDGYDPTWGGDYRYGNQTAQFPTNT